MSDFVLKTLVDKRVHLLMEQSNMNDAYKAKIAELNAAINELKGNGAIYPNEEKFDDENPDYIKSSLEEI
tara:strand:+ start:116 stop:325 length:210 start_codon:yes stop_codon:yes gene_type:complete